MNAFKHFKELEAILHQQLYNNLYLLSYTYPTTQEFDAIFKKDMFVKNNKAAFQHVIYYLLTILNPELTKQKITVWPLYEVKLESKFRTEIMDYIAELNSIYKDANIPIISASHLISPVGYKFVKFILKLSQLVLHEHLKKDVTINSQLLGYITPNRNSTVTNITLQNVKRITTSLEVNSESNYEHFVRNFVNYSQEASNILFEQSQVNNDLNKFNQLCDSKKNVFQRNDYVSIQESLNQKLDEIKNNSVCEIKELCRNYNDQLMYLSSTSSVLEFNKSEVIPSKIVGVASLQGTDRGKLNLHHLYSDLITVLEQENLEMPIYTVTEVNNLIKMVAEIMEKYTFFNEKLISSKNNLEQTLDLLQPISEYQRNKNPLILITEID